MGHTLSTAAGRARLSRLGERLREEALPPYAPAMLDSMRAIGYSFEAALADIVDNSVAAEATRSTSSSGRRAASYSP